MANNRWVETTLNDLIAVRHGFAFKGEYFRDEPPGCVLLTPGNFAIGGGFRGDKLKYYVGPVPEEFVLDEGELLVTMTDLSKQADTLGYPALVPKWRGVRFLHNQRLGRVVVRQGAPVSKEFLFYVLCTREYRHEVVSTASGTTVKHTSPTRIQGFRFKLPPLVEQQCIVHILGTLDDKIELNRRMNQTMEKIAAAIFKSWFMDFDPVRAKAEGRDPGLPQDIADLFPDEFKDSELDEIPKGWRVKPIGEVVRCFGGATPSTSNPAFWEGGAHLFVTPKDMSALQSPVILDSERHITHAGVDKISSRQLPLGTVLLSSRAPIGYLAMTDVPVSVNQGIIAMICDGGLPNLYVLHWTKASMDIIKSRAGGTTFAEISKRNFRPIPTVVPPPNVLNAFMDAVRCLHDRIALNTRQNRRLAGLRDTLLPKLLSGEIDVAVLDGLPDDLVETGQPVQKSSSGMRTETVIYTIGHSNHPIDKFIGLLKRNGITAVGDVRSVPYSRFHPQFNKDDFAASLEKAGIAYLFLGQELGARPDDGSCYKNGQVDFSRMADRAEFKRGLDHVVKGSGQHRIALMCAEKEPLDCHRTILVCRNLKAHGLGIKHILANGLLEDHKDAEARLLRTADCEPSLFDQGTSESDRLDEAYRKRGQEISFKPERQEARRVPR